MVFLFLHVWGIIKIAFPSGKVSPVKVTDEGGLLAVLD